MNSQTLFAEQVVRSVSRLVRTIFYRIEALSPEQKADDSIFLRFYEEVESALISEIHTSFPKHTIYSKYRGKIERETDDARRHVWYISGMTAEENFQRGCEEFFISLAYEIDGKLKSGVLYNPITDKLALASAKEGALFDDKKLRSPKCDGELPHAHLLTLLGREPALYQTLATLRPKIKSLHSLGDGVGSILQVIKGQASAFFTFEGLAKEDMMAILLITKEAGLLVTNFKGGEDIFTEGRWVVTPARLLKPLLIALNT